jgi:hypothetical protein
MKPLAAYNYYRVRETTAVKGGPSTFCLDMPIIARKTRRGGGAMLAAAALAASMHLSARRWAHPRNKTRRRADS